jgi:iron complex transport system substrate-binding protein
MRLTFHVSRVIAALVLLACPAAALRVISLAPSVTETLFALGLGEQVVGVSVYCDYPPEVARIDRVGTFLSPNVEAIVAKRPDLVIVVPSPGNHTPVETLQRLGIEVLVVDPASILEIKDSILKIGKALAHAAEARQLVASIEARLAATRQRLAGAPQRKVLMVVGQTPLIAVGQHTMQDELIAMANGINLGAKAGGSWPHISIEFALTEAPDVIIDTTMGNEERPGAAAALEFWGAFPALPAVREKRVYGFHEYQLLRPGPRVADAFETIARFVQPERMK